MCVVSMIMDHYGDEWERRMREWQRTDRQHTNPPQNPFVTPQEVEEFKRLLERAREYDKKNNEPDCELEEKRAKLKKLAEELGVAIEFV